jgi:hypothetical protein
MLGKNWGNGGTIINHEWITGYPHEVKEIQWKALGHDDRYFPHSQNHGKKQIDPPRNPLSDSERIYRTPFNVIMHLFLVSS